jgi:uncharacterized protein (DUF58 family)
MPITTRPLKLIFLYVAGLFLLVVAALFHQEEHLYLMAAALFLIPTVANLVGRLFIGGLTCERGAPPPCSVGERVTVTLQVTAVGMLPVFFLRVQDRLPRWMRLVGEGAPLILQLRPGESRAVTYMLEPEKRGVFALGPVLVVTTDPFGFYSYTQSLPCTEEILVYPSVIPLKQLFVDGGGAWGRENREEGGMRGDGLDFHGVRPYRTGDALRRVHWRTTARTGKLAVMEYTQGMTGDVLLALDLNRDAYSGTGEGPESALEYAVQVAAAVGAYLLQQGHAVRLLMARESEPSPALQRAEDIPRLLDMLAQAEADSPQKLSGLLQESQFESADGRTLIFITPDASDPTLAPVLEDCRALGAGMFGFFLDGLSFRDRGRSEPDLLPAWATVAPVQRIGRGDDLQEMIEGWNYAHR